MTIQNGRDEPSSGKNEQINYRLKTELRYRRLVIEAGPRVLGLFVCIGRG
jgi:hypothetical protein